PHRSSDRKAGNTNISIRHHGRVVIVSNLLAPDHDRPLFNLFLQFVQMFRPDLIIFLGRIVNDHAFQLVAPRATRDLDEDEPPLAEEVVRAKASSEVWEERAINLARILGQEIFVRTVEAAGPQCRLVYVPALEGTHQNLPPE